MISIRRRPHGSWTLEAREGYLHRRRPASTALWSLAGVCVVWLVLVGLAGVAH